QIAEDGDAALDALRREPGVILYGPLSAADKGGVITFNLEGIHPHDVAQALDQEGIAVRGGHHCAMPLMRRLGVPGTARASFYLYNTEAEIEVLVAGLAHVRRLFE
ncbi:MAG: aminotransferase class V-fold PLP-dependent enzyme, partial [Candidatus Rokubacteria bacterium]|nr:aminotransferase class V-fold PLP-dependent enzyme [Candidatus Rokubacteria bacterium]